jgi:hypothetical protein
MGLHEQEPFRDERASAKEHAAQGRRRPRQPRYRRPRVRAIDRHEHDLALWEKRTDAMLILLRDNSGAPSRSTPTAA